MGRGLWTRRLVAALTAAALALPSGAQAQSRQQQQAQFVESLGGRYDGPVAAYVAQVGERVAAAAGRPRQCAFTVVNSDVVNAFATAPPGCNVYVTRGLLSIINSEAELAAVLGHEVGHVAANHSGRRQQRSVLTGLGAVLLGVVTGSGDLARLAGQFGQLNVLSYSRGQEFEADNLGIRYLQQLGYEPGALADMLQALQREDELEARIRGREEAKGAPAWARTHPLTSDRIARALDQARRNGPPGALPEREAPFLSAVDGMLYGDDPAQGFVLGNRFAHPGLGIGFEAPPGFTLTNSSRAVGIQGPNSERGEFSTGPVGRSLEDYAYGVLERLVGRTPAQAEPPVRTRINGLEAVILPARAQTNSGVVEVTVAAYQAGGSAYHFVTLAPAGRGRIWDPLFGSFHRLSAREAAELRPRRLEIVTARPGDTAASLAARMAYDDLREERFRLLNGLGPGEPIRPGQPVKVVTFAPR